MVKVDASTFFPVYFAQKPTRLTVDGFSVKETPLSALNFYVFNGKSFVQATEFVPGACFVAFPELWNGHNVTFHFAGSQATAAFSEIFTGNGTTSQAICDKRSYQYNAQTNTFTLQPQSTVATVNPFGTLLLAADDAPQTIAGPSVAVGVHSLQVNKDAEVCIFDVQGHKQSSSSLKHAQPGTYIVNGKKVVVK